jgi:hypothetical protein
MRNITAGWNVSKGSAEMERSSVYLYSRSAGFYGMVTAHAGRIKKAPGAIPGAGGLKR